MLQPLSGDISTVKIPLAGLKTSSSQRKLLHETEQRVQPSFSDKGIKHFASVCAYACVRICVCVCVCGTEAAPQKDSPTAKHVEAGLGVKGYHNKVQSARML